MAEVEVMLILMVAVASCADPGSSAAISGSIAELDADLSNILADLNSSAAWPARELEEASCSIHCYVDHCSECYNKECSSGSLACWTLKKTPRGVYKCKPCYRNSGCSSASYDELEEA